LLKCPSGYFANSTSNLCEADCPGGFADIITRSCVLTALSCTKGYYADTATKTCALPGIGCSFYADIITQRCVPIDGCSILLPTYFSDPTTFLCVAICPNSITALTPFGLFGDTTDRTCKKTCSGNQIGDPQNNRRCVDFGGCSRSPILLFGDTTVNYICVTVDMCPSDTFADNSTLNCVNNCLDNILKFADSLSRFCVSKCPNNTWGVNNICNSSCNAMYADNITGLCTILCTSNTYGVSYDNNSYIYGIC
jgi:hypothetical protein